MWQLDTKESLAPKNWCFWTVVLEQTHETLLDCKEIQPVYPKGDQSWVFIGRTDIDAETPILWPPHWRADSLEKTWCWERLRAGVEGDDRGWDGWMVHQLNWHGFGWTPGVGDGQGGLACCGSWGHRVRHDWVTELNWTDFWLLFSIKGYIVGFLCYRHMVFVSTTHLCCYSFQHP